MTIAEKILATDLLEQLDRFVRLVVADVSSPDVEDAVALANYKTEFVEWLGSREQ